MTSTRKPKPMQPPPNATQIDAWAAEDPDMAAGLKITGKAAAPTLVQLIRRKLNLSQSEFATLYGIPVSCIRAWEIRRSKPDAGMMSYLEAIAGDPHTVAKALEKGRTGKLKIAEHA